MYEDYFGLAQPPFNITPDPRFVCKSPVYQEAFATLRYGIEARRGIVVVTGEVGTGKTTLLKMFLQSAESTIHTAFIVNPMLSFTELLRFILSDLGVSSGSDDRLSLMEELNRYLIQQLMKGDIVALLVDEAHDLSDEVLDELRLLSNLETDKDKLLQIVLMGQPELGQKLDQPKLRQLNQRVALRCQLAPLTNHEVRNYIEFRLKTAGYAGTELFDTDAVRRVASYSRGIPRVINVICDNALLIAYGAAKKRVSGEMIEEVARDLQFTVPPKLEAAPLATDFHQEARPELKIDDVKIKDPLTSEWVRRKPPAEFQEFFVDTEPPPRARQKSSLKGVGIGSLLGFALAAGLGAIVHSEPNGDYITAIADRIGDLVGARRDLRDVNLKSPEFNEKPSGTSADPQDVSSGLNRPPSNSDEQKPPAAIENYASTENFMAPADVPTGESQEPPISTQDTTKQDARQEELPVPKTSKPAESLSANKAPTPSLTQLPKDERKSTEKIKTAAKRPPGGHVSSEVPPTDEKLEFEIYKAIYNRAIVGVEVSVKDGTAYLSGRVATERQKMAAEQAARRVPGVRYVRDQIIVSAGYLAGDRRRS
jgi:general secretion pathway protein A